MSVTILTETELRACVALDEAAIGVVENAFTALAGGKVVMPPILRLDIADHNGEVDVKTAYVPGLDSFAMKMSPGLFDNPKLGLPSTSGLMVLLSALTGRVEAVLLDNGYLTDVRTAAAGAVARATWRPRPAPPRASSVPASRHGSGSRRSSWCAISTGPWSGRATAPRRGPAPTSSRHRWALPPKWRKAPARWWALATSSLPPRRREPLIDGAALHPGLHVTAMGSDAEHKNELAPAVLAAADLFVCDRRSQSATLGELHHAIAAGALAEDAAVVELGEITAGTRPGRASDDEITVCDLTGTGVQDTAIALHAFQKATERGFGTVIET